MRKGQYNWQLKQIRNEGGLGRESICDLSSLLIFCTCAAACSLPATLTRGTATCHSPTLAARPSKPASTLRVRSTIWHSRVSTSLATLTVSRHRATLRARAASITRSSSHNVHTSMPSSTVITETARALSSQTHPAPRGAYRTHFMPRATAVLAGATSV